MKEKGLQLKEKISKKGTENTYKIEEVTISTELMEWNEKESIIKVKGRERAIIAVANDDTKLAILSEVGNIIKST